MRLVYFGRRHLQEHISPRKANGPGIQGGKGSSDDDDVGWQYEWRV
jgi:hypothetical protein